MRAPVTFVSIGLLAACTPSSSGDVDAGIDAGIDAGPSGADAGAGACGSSLGPSGVGPFAIGHVDVIDVSAGIGLDLDGINNAPVGGGSGGVGATVPGCNEEDLEGGIDNGFGQLAAGVGAYFGLEGEFDDAVSSGEVPIDFRITQMSDATAADDPCVEVTMSIGETSYVGSGALVDHAVHASFPLPVAIALPVTVPDVACDVACVDSDLVLPIRTVQVRIVLDTSNSGIVSATLGGMLFFEDTSSTQDYGSANATGFKHAILTFSESTHLMSSVETAFVGLAENARDSHMHGDGSLIPCTAPNGIPALVNRNAISIGVRLTP